MADETDRRAGRARAEPAAAALAMGEAALDPRAREYLEEQTKLTRLQIEELRREDRLRHWSLVVRHVSDVLKLSFELALALIFTGFVVVIGAAIWAAASDKGLVIEAFSVPPDLAARGLTGDVVAAKVLDKLAAMQAQTVSRRAASSYANDWGKDIKVQIPDTGVSIGELNNYLHQWLGHQTRITGEVYHADGNVAVTARAGGEASPVFAGAERDLDKLLQKAADSVYRSTQPYRYAIYLENHNRNAEADVVLQELVRTGSPDDRAWAYVGLTGSLANNGDVSGAARMARQAVGIEPDFALAYVNLASAEAPLQHDEQALAAWRQAVALDDRGENRDEDASYAPYATLSDKQNLASIENDNLLALAYGRRILAVPDRNGSWESAIVGNLQACGLLHDSDCLNRSWSAFPATKDASILLNRSGTLQFIDAVTGHWQGVFSESKSIIPTLNSLGKLGAFFMTRTEDPLLALASAGIGDFRRAHALIDNLPADCVIGLRYRGRIDALQKNWNGAGYWFARAAKAAPSQGLVWTDWGQMLLAKGDYDAAVAKFTIAVQKSPHFADPLVYWGEALMQKNRSDLALEKFAQAAQYAPNWGRLHLKWGEALLYSGDTSGAKRQFAIASRLDLTQSENSELGRMNKTHA